MLAIWKNICYYRIRHQYYFLGSSRLILKFEAAVPQMVEIERGLSFYFTFGSLGQTVFRPKTIGGNAIEPARTPSPSFFRRFRSPKRLPQKAPRLFYWKAVFFPCLTVYNTQKKRRSLFPTLCAFIVPCDTRYSSEAESVLSEAEEEES